MEPTPPSAERPSPQQAVGGAIQDLIAARLGRGFLPLGVVVVIGLVEAARLEVGRMGAVVLVVGGVVGAAAMLAYGLRTVQRAFGRPNRPWMTAAFVAGALHPLFGVYVFAWRGLRGLAGPSESGDVLLAIVFTAMGVWLLRSWTKVLEVERLSRVMAANMHEYGGSA